MGFILDLILILIVAIYVYISMKKGFVRILVEVIGYCLSIVIALSVGGMIANSVYDSHIEPAANSAITRAINEKSEEAIDAVPYYIDVYLDKADIDLKSVCSSDNVDVSVITNSLKPIAVEGIKSVVAIIIFIPLIFVVRILAKFINSFFSNFIFGGLNKVLGGMLGGIKGVIIASAFSLLVFFIASLSSKGFFIFSSSAIDSSAICRTIINMYLS